MPIRLEDLDYQRTAVDAVVNTLAGQFRNTFALSNVFGIHANVLSLSPEQLQQNIRQVILSNGIPEEVARLSPDPDLCIEMETGTGKTLVYLRTIFELYKTYGLTKFVILVPSVPIKEGILAAVEDFRQPLTDLYGFAPSFVEYDSSRIGRISAFIRDSRPQVMVMTIQSFNSDDRIINQIGRDDSYMGLTFLQALGRTRPIIIMDEPQEGMDTPNSVGRLATLNPVLRLRYSATHKVLKNLLYRLTPAQAYKQNLVKKIEVLSVIERNDEALLKLEFADVQLAKKSGAAPKARLKAWRNTAGGFQWKETNWLSAGDSVAEKTGNISYRDYSIERIWKGFDGQFRVKFRNGVELTKRERSGDYQSLFRIQLHYLIRRHFEKKKELLPKGIKPLALIFIDKVDNFMGDNPLIRNLFREEYAAAHKEVYGTETLPRQVEAVQGFYFAQTNAGDFTDSESSMLRNKEIFNRILREKSALLSTADPIEFIFTHSALGVGWDNPNVFSIATLNVAYDENRKRQEIGRGLRICRNQDGIRIYDSPDVAEGDEINLLTIVPNESYDTFAAQYQEQIKEAYGTEDAGSPLRKNVKGRDAKNVLTRTARFNSDEFKRFWERLAKKTDYTVAFDEEALIHRATEAIDAIAINAYQAEVTLTKIRSLEGPRIEGDYGGSEFETLRPDFVRLDLIEELSESTGLAYPTICRMVGGMKNLANAVANPLQFLSAAAAAIKNIEMEEMIRTLSYHPTGESIPLSELLPTIETYFPIQPTPNRGVYDGVGYESAPEHDFARDAESDNEVVCFLKLPSTYRIRTPIGKDYEPDFGLVLKRRKLRSPDEQEYYFVIETKGTSNVSDTRSLTESERLSMRCALKHFEALGIEAKLQYVPYIAPVKNYVADFKSRIPH